MNLLLKELCALRDSEAKNCFHQFLLMNNLSVKVFYHCYSNRKLPPKYFNREIVILDQRGSNKVWKNNMGVCPCLEFDIMLINCLGYDFYIYGAFDFLRNSIVNLCPHVCNHYHTLKCRVPCYNHFYIYWHIM